MRTFKEWLSIQLAKRPGRVVLSAILLFNIVFFLFSAIVISKMSLSGTEEMDFLQAAICTITMILDAGCIQFVVEDIGQVSVGVALVCLSIVLIGMISFTGAVIGYLTNTISNFIENSNAGRRHLNISGHFVILNWNTRASEIVNDLLYCEEKQKIVILANSGKEQIESEITERISDTIHRENKELKSIVFSMPLIKGAVTYHKKKLKNNLTIIIREGDVFSTKQLFDISLKRAKTVVILGSEQKDQNELSNNLREQGDTLVIKTLMQVADLTSKADSDDNQKIIVEITDNWTKELVGKIIKRKQVDGKCNIIPVDVNHILGQILSQFSLMPELNLVYKELFSNKGAAFFTEPFPVIENVDFVTKYLSTHMHAIPLTHMESGGLPYHYFTANSEKDVHRESLITKFDYSVQINPDYWIENKYVIILGHNSRSKDIMQGFSAFRGEWQRGDDEIVKIIVVDDRNSLERMDNYSAYPFVVETVAADIFDRELISKTIERCVSTHSEDTSILILSDDSVPADQTDSSALAHLVYVQDIIARKKELNPAFDEGSIDVIVEIIDPKHYDVVNGYSVKNVVISNRYISKMITQIGEKEALFDFYTDILTYDEDVSNGYQSKEIYAKKVSNYFLRVPEPCSAKAFIRAVYEATSDPSLPIEKRNPAVALGFVKADGTLHLFGGDQSQYPVELEEKDKLIVFSAH